MLILKEITIPILIVITLFVMGDKIATAIAINQLANNPNHAGDPLEGEKNPVAKWFMKNLGIVPGNIVFGLIHMLIVILLVLPALTWMFGQLKFSMANPFGFAFYTFCMIMGLVISNNIYFILKFGGHV